MFLGFPFLIVPERSMSVSPVCDLFKTRNCHETFRNGQEHSWTKTKESLSLKHLIFLKVNFHGSFPQAHSVGDTGGDVINEFELDMRYISDLGDWYIPLDDLYNIYMDLYGAERVTKQDIIECSSLLFIGRFVEKKILKNRKIRDFTKTFCLKD